MYNFSKLVTFLVMCVSLTYGETAPKMCNETSSMTFDPTKLAGIWYEVARNPAPSSSFLCAQINLTMQANNLMGISTTYSVTPLYPYVNQTMIGNVSLGAANNPYGYNFSYALGQINYPMQTFKLLDTDYNNYAFICGYDNFTNSATYFSIVLTRARMPNSTALNGYESMAAQNFTGFSNTSLTVIVQEETCVYGGGSRSIPAISTICGLFIIFSSLIFL